MNPVDADALLTDGKSLVRDLIDDLRVLVESGDPDACAVVEREHRKAVTAGRTALSQSTWAKGFYAQAAVAWVLAAVFVRFCEDNDLGPEPLLAGPGKRRDIAIDHRAAYLQEHPAHDDRHWLREIVGRYRALPATGDLFGDHNPIHLMAPSADGARTLVRKFQAVDPDVGDIRHDFTDPSWDTRFLGDLYQDLSEHAKKTYALLQTPEFVEEFILDRTLDPALKTFGLRDTTLIDPTCGSGHFLLGAFHRLLERWTEAEPGTNSRELAQRTLDAIAGVDLNPFAAAIARFRLLVAALRAGGDTNLAHAPGYKINIAVGDSLLHGDPPGRLEGILLGDELVGAAAHGYATEDVEEARALLTRKWHAVVGNPPYSTIRTINDPALNKVYRDRYKTCHGQYSLSVPFTEQFFHLARPDANRERCGYVGMINANSFMKSDFGKNLIEKWMPKHDLTHVVDTSRAHIPGHGTSTVILFGRNRAPVEASVRAVLGIRGQSPKPADPGKGLVWLSILDLIDEPGTEDDYVTVVDIDRARLSKHPWSIGGGGIAELKELLDERAARQLDSLVVEIGRTLHTGEDDVYAMPRSALDTRNWHRSAVEFVTGDNVRDWQISSNEFVLFPYRNDSGEPLEVFRGTLAHHYWLYRTSLRARLNYGETNESRGLPWQAYTMFFPKRFQTPHLIAFAYKVTHNHFAFVRGGKGFNRHAPVIKLPEQADESRHLELLGVLNSSTACFWMKQTFRDTGVGGIGGGIGDEAWEPRYEHDGTKLKAFPLPGYLDPMTATLIDQLAEQMAAVTPSAIAEAETPTGERLAEAERQYRDIRAQMIGAQERLDWEVYRQYGLIDEDLTTNVEPEPPLALGERAFEIVLACKRESGGEETSWFERHGSTPITELPAHWSSDYKRLVERRIELIESDLSIRLIERPEYKRRWAAEPWDKQAKAALRSWLLDRLETPRYWPEPAALTTTARIAAEARTDTDFVQVARLFAGQEDVDIAALVAELVKDEAVPYLAAYRYTEQGMRTYEQWLATWELQRREDAGEDVGEILLPPNYKSNEFQSGVWAHRGKLDVPKERFITYPGAERETDPSLVVGWAGWDHLARARALATWYLQAKRDGRDLDHLTPLLAGLAELLPWLKQWYDDPSPDDPALSYPGSQIAALLDTELRAHQLTAAQLTIWRPRPKGRRRSR